MEMGYDDWGCEMLSLRWFAFPSHWRRNLHLNEFWGTPLDFVQLWSCLKPLVEPTFLQQSSRLHCLLQSSTWKQSKAFVPSLAMLHFVSHDIPTLFRSKLHSPLSTLFSILWYLKPFVCSVLYFVERPEFCNFDLDVQATYLRFSWLWELLSEEQTSFIFK